MSTQSGISVSSELLGRFNKIALNGTDEGDSKRLRAIIAEIDKETLVEKDQLVSTSTPQADLSGLPTLLKDSTPCFVFYMHRDSAVAPTDDSYSSYKHSKEGNWTFVSYVPMDASVRAKFLYGSSKNTIMKQLGENRFANSVFITAKSDVKEIFDSQKHSAESAMTESEKALEDIKKQERLEGISTPIRAFSYSSRQNSASSSSSNVSNPASNLNNTAKGLKWADDIEEALKNLASPNPSHSAIQLLIDTKGEELQLAPETTLDLPANDPRFAFANVDDKIFFVYSCPPTSNVRTRFIYSTSVLKIVNHAKSIGVDVVKRVETSDPKEINADYLRNELNSMSPGISGPMVAGVIRNWGSGNINANDEETKSNLVRTPTPFASSASSVGATPAPAPPLATQFSRPKRPGR